jgi:hypothetical protein
MLSIHLLSVIIYFFFFLMNNQVYIPITKRGRKEMLLLQIFTLSIITFTVYLFCYICQFQFPLKFKHREGPRMKLI